MSHKENLTEVRENTEGVIEDEKETGVVEKIKRSDLGKTFLGDDGKFDREDIKRLSEEAGSIIKEGMEKVKSLFQYLF